MDINVIERVVSSQFAYLILFIGVLVYVHKLISYVLKESNKREVKMRDQLDKTVPILEKILIRLDVIEEKIEK